MPITVPVARIATITALALLVLCLGSGESRAAAKPDPTAAAAFEPYFEVPPQLVRAKGDAEWQLWYYPGRDKSERAYGKLFIVGKEVLGAKKGEKRATALGSFAWIGGYEDRNPLDFEVLSDAVKDYFDFNQRGWAPEDKAMLFSEYPSHPDAARERWLPSSSELRNPRVLELLRLTRQSPDLRKAQGKDLWVQWFHLNRESVYWDGYYGALRLNGKWMMTGRPGDKLACSLGEFIYQGDYIYDPAAQYLKTDSRAGWASSSATLRENLKTIFRYDGKDGHPGAARAVKDQLAWGLNPSERDEDEGTYLMWAARYTALKPLDMEDADSPPEPEALEALIKAGADVNARDKRGITALLYAAMYNNNPRLFSALLRAGADANPTDKEGRTALMIVIDREVSGIARALVEGGADVNRRDGDGQTALMLSAGRNNTEEVKLLIGAGADVNARDNNGRTPLLHVFSWSGIGPVTKALLEAGADANAADNEGNTALMLAAEYARLEMLELLVKAGADVNLRNKQGKTALELAEDWYGLGPVTQSLLEAGADPNTADHSGSTALMTAAVYSHREILEFLIKAGADVNLRNKAGKTALDLAKEAERYDEAIIRLLREAGAK